MRRIESVSRSAAEITRTLSGAPGRSGMVSVTTICSNGALRGSRKRCRRRRRAWRRVDLLGPRLGDGAARGGERAGGIDHVVDDDRGLVLHITDHVADLGDLLGRAILVEDREAGAELARELLVELHAAGIRGDDDDILQVEILEVLGEHEQRRHVIDGALEEALDLAGVEIHREDAISAGALEHPGDHAGADRLARRALLSWRL